MKITIIVTKEYSERKKYPDTPSSIRRNICFADTEAALDAVLSNIRNDIHELRGMCSFGEEGE